MKIWPQKKKKKFENISEKIRKPSLRLRKILIVHHHLYNLLQIDKVSKNGKDLFFGWWNFLLNQILLHYLLINKYVNCDVYIAQLLQLKFGMINKIMVCHQSIFISNLSLSLDIILNSKNKKS